MEQNQFKPDFQWDIGSIKKMISLACLSDDYIKAEEALSESGNPLDELLHHRILQPSERKGTIGRLDRWDILEIIGMGGMGIVLLAEENSTSRKKAIKVLRPQFLSDPGVLGHFLEEIHVVSNLDHPYIAPLENEQEELGGTAFMVMPYYSLGSLDSILGGDSELDAHTILKLTRCIAEGLAYAHSKGIIHFDLKPGNILLESANHPRIADFGLAKNLATGLASSSSPHSKKGTLPYMSPGIIEGQAEYMLSDIYSLGAVVYEMLTGKHPYHGYQGTNLREHILNSPPIPILKLRPKADPALSYLADYMMNREPTKRLPSMKHVIEQLDKIENEKATLHVRPQSTIKSHDSKQQSPMLVNRLAFTLLCLSLILLFLKSFSDFSSYKINPKNALIKEIDSIHIGRWERLHFIQWDGLKGLEFALAQDQDTMVFNNDGRLLKRWSLDEPKASWSRPTKPLNVSGDARKEIAIEWGNTNITEVVCFDQNPRAVSRFSVIPSPHNDRNLTFTTTLSLELTVPAHASATGRPLVIAQCGTYHSNPKATPWKRGIHAFDKETGKQIWDTRFGPPPNGIHAVDLDTDGKLDFVMGSSSVGNGNIGSDRSSDAIPYIFAVNAYGKQMWRQQFGGEGEACSVLGTAINHDNHPIIYVGLATGEFAIDEQAPERTRILVLDHQGNPVKSFSTNKQLQHIKVLEFEEKSKSAVIFSDQTGNVYLLKGSQSWDSPPHKSLQLAYLSKSKSSRIDRVVCSFLDQGSYTHKDANEIAILTYEDYNSGDLNSNDATRPPHITEYRNPTIHIVNTDLAIVAQMPFDTAESDPPRFRSADLDEDGIYEVLRTADTIEVYTMNKN